MGRRFQPVRVGSTVAQAAAEVVKSLGPMIGTGTPCALLIGVLVRDAHAGRLEPRFRWIWQSCQVANLAEPRALLYADAATALKRLAEGEADA